MAATQPPAPAGSRNRSVLSHEPVLAWMTDADLRVMMTRGTTIGGVASTDDLLEDVVGSGPARDLTLEAHRRALRGEATSYEALWQRRRYQVYVAPMLGADGTPAGTVGIALDITAATRRERILAHSLHKEQRLSDGLREALALQETFVQGLSHDIRGPLTTILGFAHTLQRTDISWFSREQRLLLDRIIAGGEQIESLVGELLDAARVDGDRIRLNAEPVALLDVCRTAVSSVEADHVGVEVTGEACVAAIDRGLIERAVANLVVNAVRHSPTGTTVTVRVEDAGGHCVIAVEDEGAGVADDLKPNVFKPFVGRSGGTGLGLALVARFTRVHGGTVWVEDRPGGGARFGMRLPKEQGGPRRSGLSPDRPGPGPSG